MFNVINAFFAFCSLLIWHSLCFIIFAKWVHVLHCVKLCLASLLLFGVRHILLGSQYKCQKNFPPFAFQLLYLIFLDLYQQLQFLSYISTVLNDELLVGGVLPLLSEKASFANCSMWCCKSFRKLHSCIRVTEVWISEFGGKESGGTNSCALGKSHGQGWYSQEINWKWSQH